ncbi:sarcoplasmic calcium-binding proteins II, V, VI, and VII isoform X3 [Lingula anatina]|uniref:Sarcoplasmic calcium-binding proteins II, V, VI, and VII isoform X3 n=1 Tax=Lingula anatina TaxID=7574 RepID=A0A1S3KFX7_LINAN|nr:sarcoplasmic calcium-binding proteins II, V, VI, and VII-like [Lingula anatina]XP_013421364.1 sarcoplasmic calcium-binding proteins II, V, VI, and VII isoform X3 [Lingula anatina]|eukprot:XP_013392875.1 sarcoplasmic calcium-binding proteins II, V, VI, and VII-like [Lingula anatina]
MATGHGEGYELSDFLKAKYEHVFVVLFDATHDKVVSRTDFVNLLRKVADIHDSEVSDPSYKILQERIASIMAGLMKGNRAHKSSRPLEMHMNLEEWLTHWSEFVAAAQSRAGWPDTSLDGKVDYSWQKDLMDFLFDVIDLNGDGVIDLAEFTECFAEFDINDWLCETAFKKMTEGTKDVLDRTRFEQIW